MVVFAPKQFKSLGGGGGSCSFSFWSMLIVELRESWGFWSENYAGKWSPVSKERCEKVGEGRGNQGEEQPTLQCTFAEIVLWEGKQRGR